MVEETTFVNREDGSRSKVDVNLLKYTFEPDDDRLSELTDIPLNQVNPLSWIITFETATKQLEELIEYAARKKAGENGASKPKPVLLSEVWRKYYYKHRRSLEGAGKMMASTLAMKQLETQEPDFEAGDQLARRQ